MRKIFSTTYILVIWSIFMLILLKTKNKVVISGYFTSEMIMFFLLAMLPLVYFCLKKHLFEKEKNVIKCIAYFPIGLLIGMIIPIANFFIIYFFAIPFLGFEKEKYLESEHFRVEKAYDIISSGGQATFEVYQKGNFFDKIIDEFSEYKHNVEKAELIDNYGSYKIKYQNK
jgi:hypothetical protein